MAAQNLVGFLHEYQVGDDWGEFTERLDAYFDANGIGDDGKKRSVLLTVCGSQVYSTMKSLLSPVKPNTKTYADLVKLVRDYFSPKPITIVERFKFYHRAQQPHETLSQYLAALRKASEHCEFGAELDNALRDRFVCGIQSDAIQKKLLQKADLTLKTAQETALLHEAADTQSQQLHAYSVKAVKSNVGQYNADDRRQSQYVVQKECWRCGKNNHSEDRCFYKLAQCHNCEDIGHLSRKCKKPVKPHSSSKSKTKKKSVKSLEIQSDSDSDAESQSFPLSNVKMVNCEGDKEIIIPILLQNKNFDLELDTGSAVSLISKKTYDEHFSNMKLQPCSLQLCTYTEGEVKVLGQIEVDVNYNDNAYGKLPLVVVEGKGNPLFGRNWLRIITLNWPSIKNLYCKGDVLSDVKRKYSNLFMGTLGKMNNVKASLQLREDSKPKYFKARPVPFALKEKVANELNRMETVGVLEKVSVSDWAAPIVPVPKTDGTVRICGDFKVTVNPCLEVPEYPFPTVDELFAKLNGGKKFTKLDLSHAYQQIELENESRDFVCINTHMGLYRYTRLPYGVASAPAICQQTMDKVLQGIDMVGCILDDIIITGKNDEEHLQNLDTVLQRLSDFNVQLNASKCFFMQESVEYFAFKVDEKGIHPTEQKLRSMKDAPSPQNKDQLKSWLGLVNYYRKFIPNMATEASVLQELLKDKSVWKWSPDCERAFNNIKNALCSDAVLVHYNPSLPLVLATDASPTGVAAVISHVMPTGEEKPIAYASRTLTEAERNYSQIEREGLAIIFGIQKYHIYCYGRRFSLVTDNQPLAFIFGPKKGIPVSAASRIQRWAIQLSGYQYDVVVKRSKEHANADGLSRLPVKDTVREKAVGIFSLSEIHKFHVKQLNTFPVTSKQVAMHTAKDVLLCRVKHYIQFGWPSKANLSSEFYPYFNAQNELTIEQNCILRGTRVVIPKTLQNPVLEELHTNHLGIVKMKSVGRNHFWWPNLDKEIEQVVANCMACKTQSAMPATRCNMWEWPTNPWHRIHVDFAGPFENRMYLLVIDAHSKWLEVIHMKSTTSESTVNALRKLFASHGLPLVLVSDNGPQFTSADFQKFMQHCGIKHILNSPFHPSSNGEIERAVKTFKNYMKKNRGSDLGQRLTNFLLCYRTVPHGTTQTTPAELFLKRKLRTRLDLLRPDLQNKIGQQQAKSLKHAREFMVGDKLFARDYRIGQPKWTECVVVSVLGPVTYTVQTKEGYLWKRHVDQLIINQSVDIFDKNEQSGVVVDAQCDVNGNSSGFYDCLSDQSELTGSENDVLNLSEEKFEGQNMDTQNSGVKEGVKNDVNDREPVTQRRSGRQIKKPDRLIESS